MFDDQTTTLELRKMEDDRTRPMNVRNWLSCPVVGSRLLNLVKRRRTVLHDWFVESDSSCPVAIPEDVVKRRNNPTLDDCFLAPLLFVCGGQTTIFGFRQVKDNSSWGLIPRICLAVDRLWRRWRIKVCYFYRMVYDAVSRSRVFGPILQYHKSLPSQ